MRIKKYTTIMKTAWQKQLTHRANFIGFRIGNFLEILTQIIIWSVVFKGADVIRGYTYEEMITYVVFGWLIYFLSHNYGIENVISMQVYNGRMSNFLTKPISYLKYITALSIGRVSIALSSAILTQIIIIILFHDKLILNVDPINLLIIAAMVILGYFIKLFFSVLIGSISFWTIEIIGIYFCLNVLIKFLSGSYFPINLLPDYLVNISMAFPFVYVFFIPAQLYLGKITTMQGLYGIGVEIIWLFLLYIIIKIVWKRGLKKYEGVGI